MYLILSTSNIVGLYNMHLYHLVICKNFECLNCIGSRYSLPPHHSSALWSCGGGMCRIMIDHLLNLFSPPVFDYPILDAQGLPPMLRHPF